ncbi:MAG TPA: OmpA family protein [Anaeromyxobacteraceae bacterium]|nr:OmpA family protein [Anaeromyxobacteraceae bacterium]
MLLLTLLLAFADPGAPDTEAAAEGAVARLGAKQALDIAGATVNIQPGVTVRIEILPPIGLMAVTQGLEQAMHDLGATETAVGIQLDLPDNVLFDFRKSTIRPEAAQTLAKLAVIIRAWPKGCVRLEGHTDSIGSDGYNQRLSERRAKSVKKWLIEKEGFDPSRLIANGWGKTKPVAPNDTEANRQRNRRLHAIIEKQ